MIELSLSLSPPSDDRLENQKTSAAEFLAMEYDVPEAKQFNSTLHKLQGPYNPLEMRMYGKVKTLLGSTLKIEDDSVNSVMLDDQPGDRHERVLVAAYVGELLIFNYGIVVVVLEDVWYLFCVIGLLDRDSIEL